MGPNHIIWIPKALDIMIQEEELMGKELVCQLTTTRRVYHNG